MRHGSWTKTSSRPSTLPPAKPPANWRSCRGPTRPMQVMGGWRWDPPTFRGFHILGVPQNGWLRLENPINGWWLGVALFQKANIWEMRGWELQIQGGTNLDFPDTGQAAQRARASCSLTCGVLDRFSQVESWGDWDRWSWNNTQNTCQSNQNAISILGYAWSFLWSTTSWGNHVSVNQKKPVKFGEAGWLYSPK